MKRLNKQGFSMIELLVVLLIIGILAAVAAPLFFANSTKAIISEAVAGAGAIRSGERTYDSQNNTYLQTTADETLYFGTGGASAALLGVTIHGNKYFSPICYTVTYPATAWPGGTKPASLTTAPLDFLILVDGTNSESLGTDPKDGASNNTAVKQTGSIYEVAMDNSGQTIYTIDGGTTWNNY
jgi:prepilin-type N-terminal cleavage/methylation domain-containing protein